jgi:hypothetical protein
MTEGRRYLSLDVLARARARVAKPDAATTPELEAAAA